MDFVKATDLAPLIPLETNEVAFQYQFFLDNSFEDPGKHVGAVKFDESQLPYQFFKLMYKPDGNKWYVGFNVFQEGADTRYQSFFWHGSQPDSGRLESDGNWKQASSVYDLDLDDPQEARVHIPKYDWLVMNTKPVNVHFDLEAGDHEVTFEPVEYQVQIASRNSYENNTDHEKVAHPKVSYEYEQEAGTSVTDTITYEVGASVSLQFKLNIPFVSTSWTVKLDFQYTTSQATTASYSEKKIYKIEELLDVILPPHSITYISIVIYTADDVTGELTLDMRMSGQVDGEPLSGDYLRDMAEAMSADNISQVDSETITYTLTSTVEANVLSESQIVIDDEPVKIENGKLVNKGRIIQVKPTEDELVST